MLHWFFYAERAAALSTQRTAILHGNQQNPANPGTIALPICLICFHKNKRGPVSGIVVGGKVCVAVCTYAQALILCIRQRRCDQIRAGVIRISRDRKLRPRACRAGGLHIGAGRQIGSDPRCATTSGSLDMPQPGCWALHKLPLCIHTG